MIDKSDIIHQLALKQFIMVAADNYDLRLSDSPNYVFVNLDINSAYMNFYSGYFNCLKEIAPAILELFDKIKRLDENNTAIEKILSNITELATKAGIL